ncbi:MAG: hypothetical protein Greene041662_473 [Candidatus Peregrinibacteria bacterium Greene0416_62]|nr:MAG: hypothetical protein Greene041662_473 [Candidatus Peregrinibacteria bacterium Greene0416_62]TSC99987.1 MAG: hypothetical protein Greene101449_427 [Candidatus Peregrinibacteria bacterium Greene1014_49]
MIDSVLLKIPDGKFTVTRYDKFQPNARGLFMEPYLPFHGEPFIRCVQNPSKEDLLAGEYWPRLTIFKRRAKVSGFAINLHIELSLPKLLYGNNFDELEDKDFEEIIRILKTKLLLMGVLVSKDNLRSASVYAVHYSKNVIFEDYTAATLPLSYLDKIKLNRHMDLTKTDFRNGGEAVRYYSKSHEFVAYDKIADLKQSKDRAMEKKDRECNLQMDLFETIREKKPLEVLRLELRLKSKQKMIALFKSLKIESDLGFQALFSKKISQRLLLHYWNGIYDELRPVLLQEITPPEQFTLIARQRKQWTGSHVLRLIAVCAMVRAEGHRKTRNRLKPRCSVRTLERVFKDIKGLEFRILNKAAPFEHITRSLHAFVSVKQKDFTLPIQV